MEPAKPDSQKLEKVIPAILVCPTHVCRHDVQQELDVMLRVDIMLHLACICFASHSEDWWIQRRRSSCFGACILQPCDATYKIILPQSWKMGSIRIAGLADSETDELDKELLSALDERPDSAHARQQAEESIAQPVGIHRPSTKAKG